MNSQKSFRTLAAVALAGALVPLAACNNKGEEAPATQAPVSSSSAPTSSSMSTSETGTSGSDSTSSEPGRSTASTSSSEGPSSSTSSSSSSTSTSSSSSSTAASKGIGAGNGNNEPYCQAIKELDAKLQQVGTSMNSISGMRDAAPLVKKVAGVAPNADAKDVWGAMGTALEAAGSGNTQAIKEMNNDKTLSSKAEAVEKDVKTRCGFALSQLGN